MSSGPMGNWIPFADTTQAFRIALESKPKNYERTYKEISGFGPNPGIHTGRAFACDPHHQRPERSAAHPALANVRRQRGVLFHILLDAVSTENRLGDCRRP